MASLTHHVNKLKEQPSHVRERVVLGVSGGITVFVAVGWMMAMSSSGAFSLATNSIAESVRPPESVTSSVTQTGEGLSSLLGAASAALGNPSQASAITVVETHTSSTLENQPASSSTSLPF